ncbi:MAG: hypothetical protein HGA47_11255 [Zoogloea sp.]|nr:hypothetical protein [Zoogloea sp.]
MSWHTPLRTARRPAAWLAAALIAGCAAPPSAPPIETPAETPAAPPAPDLVRKPAPPLARHGLKPMPVVPLTVRTTCSFHDDTGYNGTARIEVASSEVRAFAATFEIPRHGSCRFDLAQFYQTARLPSVELTGPQNCRVRMWEQGEQVTVAFSGCHSLCSPGSAHDYVWPILIDRPSGTCD